MNEIQDSTNPTQGLQKRKCPKCERNVEFYIRQTWIDHLEYCKGKRKMKCCRVKTERKDLIFETQWGKICPHGQNERVMAEPTNICEGCEFITEEEMTT